MKRIIRILFVIFLSIVLISSFPKSTAAATDSLLYHFDYGCNLKLLNGVGDWGNNTRYYWVDSSASNYQNTIYDAVYTWVNTTSRLNYSTPISITRTYTKSSSVFDVYLQNLFSEEQSVLGVTYHYLNNNSVNTDDDWAPTQSWYWTKIILNNPNFEALGIRNNMGPALARQSVVAHEFGHAMGLDHSTALNADGTYMATVVMLQLDRGRYVWQPMYPDLYVINHLYA